MEAGSRLSTTSPAVDGFVGVADIVLFSSKLESVCFWCNVVVGLMSGRVLFVCVCFCFFVCFFVWFFGLAFDLCCVSVILTG